MNSDKRLIRNTSGAVMEDDGATGGRLIVGAGGVVPEADEADVKAFFGDGSNDDGAASAGPQVEGKAVSAPPENKAVIMPPESKMATQAMPKGRR